MRSDGKRTRGQDGLHRRDFLKTATGGTAAGVVTAVLAGGTAPAAAAAEPAAGRSRYRETEHVRRAYRLARF